MYGRKKKILIVVIILAVIAIIGGVGYSLISNRGDRLDITYVGGDKYVDDNLDIKDFKVVDKKTNKTISSKQLQLSAKPLDANGIVATITYTTTNGHSYVGQKTVYPTLVVEKITAELIPENKHIGSKISKEDFKVIGTNNKGDEVELKNFNISHTVLKSAENDVKIEYATSAGTVSTTLHISVTENFVVGVEAKYIGKSVFVGEDVNDDDFEVYAVWDDGAKTKVQDYNVDDPTLSDDSSIVTVSITDDLGNNFYTDVKIKAVNYVVDIESVAYVGQEQTVGNSVKKSDFEVYGTYYDGKTDKVENFKIKSGKVLKTVENTVEISVKNELGNEITYSTQVNAEQNIIYVGDSRMKELQAYEGTEDAIRNRDQEKEQVYYVYDDNANLDWFNTSGKAQVQDIIDKNPYTTFRIVLNLGMLDYDNLDNYIAEYTKLAKTTWKSQRLYIDSLNPIDEAQLEKSGVYSRDLVSTTKINDFNKKLSQSISNANLSNMKYLNTYGSLTNAAYKTTDGYHYTSESYEAYHNSVKKLAI